MLNQLPEDIIQNNIIPYTYNPQPKKLCKDITTYYFTLNKMFNMYKLVFNKDIWLNILKTDVKKYYFNNVLLKEYTILDNYMDTVSNVDLNRIYHKYIRSI